MIWPQCCVLENSLLSPRGGFTPQKDPFLAKMVLFSLYLQNYALDFDDLCTDVLEIVVLSDLASGLCARKFSFAPQGGLTPENASS